MNGDDDHILAALRAGAGGTCLSTACAQEVERAIRSAAAEGMVSVRRWPRGSRRSLRLLDALKRPEEVLLPELIEPERMVLHRLAAGRSNDQIAGELYVSNKTVRNAVSSIYAELHAGGRSEAIAKARGAGLGRRS